MIVSAERAIRFFRVEQSSGTSQSSGLELTPDPERAVHPLPEVGGADPRVESLGQAVLRVDLRRGVERALVLGASGLHLDAYHLNPVVVTSDESMVELGSERKNEKIQTHVERVADRRGSHAAQGAEDAALSQRRRCGFRHIGSSDEL